MQRKNIIISDETVVNPMLKGYFGYCLFKCSAKFRALMDESLSKYKIQVHHLGVLKLLELNGPSSQIKLGDDLGIDKATMVKMIDHLEKNKLVLRRVDPKDRRIKNIEMTAFGRRLFRNCHKVKLKAEKEFFKDLDPKQVESLKQILITLLKD